MSQSSAIVSEMSENGYYQHELNDIAKANRINPGNITSIVQHLLRTGQIEQIGGRYYKTNIIYMNSKPKIQGQKVHVKIPWEDLDQMEKLIKKRIFSTRSQIVREAVKKYFEEEST